MIRIGTETGLELYAARVGQGGKQKERAENLTFKLLIDQTRSWLSKLHLELNQIFVSLSRESERVRMQKHCWTLRYDARRM